MKDPILIRAARKGYHAIFGSYREQKLKDNYFKKKILDGNAGNAAIAKLISSDKPALVCRFGSTEMFAISNYFEINELKNSSGLVRNLRKIKGESDIWRERVKYEMEIISGFFPITDSNLNRFVELYIKLIPEIDILGVWHNYYEDIISRDYCPNAQLITLPAIEPYYFDEPWSKHLEGKKVLVVNYFSESINNQFMNREHLFANKNVLPPFQLITLKSVWSGTGVKTKFKDWFEALESMKNEMAKIDFDVAIIGAGTYGFPLAAFAKELGKQAIHMGGATQLLFGIKGKRWDNHPKISALYNDFWNRPLVSETPEGNTLLENGTFW